MFEHAQLSTADEPIHAERDTAPGTFPSCLEPSMTNAHTYASAAPNRRGPLGR